MAGASRRRKYHSGNLMPMLRLAARLRRQMNDAGFTDNGGAIHSAERIVNLLGLHLKYPGLSHINNLRQYPKAEFSVKAHAAYKRGERVMIEHVAPLRAFTRQVIARIERGATDAGIKSYIRAHYRLVLLTPEEAQRLNKRNRTKMEPERLALSGIRLMGSRDKRSHTR